MNSHIKAMVDEAIGLLRAAAESGPETRAGQMEDRVCVPAIGQADQSDVAAASRDFEALLGAMDKITEAARGMVRVNAGFSIADRSEQDRLMRSLARIAKKLLEMMTAVNNAAPAVETADRDQSPIALARISGDYSVTEEIARQATLLALNVRLLRRRERAADSQDCRHWQP